MNSIGLDLGGTKSASAIFDEQGNIIKKDIAVLKNKSGQEVGDLIIEQINSLLQFANSQNFIISSIGISVPGIYWTKQGTVWAPNISGWENYPLFDELKKNLPEAIQIKIDSDRACYILGEVWCGAAKGASNAIFMAVGTGIGLGVLIDGRILRGANDIAGATGWMALDRPFRSEYVSCGCFEYQASGEGIAKVTRELLNKYVDYTGQLRDINIDEITATHVFEAYEREDEIAILTLNNAIELWGMAIANYISLFNPEKIILGGGVFGPAIQFLDRIKAEAIKWAQPISSKYVEIIPAALGGDAGLYGAGYLSIMKG